MSINQSLKKLSIGIFAAYQLMLGAALPLYASEPVGNTLEEEVLCDQTKDEAEKVMVFKDARDIFETYDGILKLLKGEIYLDTEPKVLLSRRHLAQSYPDELEYVLLSQKESYVFIIGYYPDIPGRLTVPFLSGQKIEASEGLQLVAHESLPHPMLKDSKKTILLISSARKFPFGKGFVMDAYYGLVSDMPNYGELLHACDSHKSLPDGLRHALLAPLYPNYDTNLSEDQRVAKLLFNFMLRGDIKKSIVGVDIVGLYPPKFTDSPLGGGNLNEDLEELERQIELLKNQHSQTMTPETEAMTQEAR